MGYFDHFARSPTTPIGRWIIRNVKQREFSLLRPYLPNRGCAILEIGPGMGEMANILRETGYWNYTAVEPNPTMRRQLVASGFAVKDYLIPHLNEADNSCDAIILINVFEHLNGTREAETFIAEARRVLRTGGILHISAPDYRHWKEEFFLGDYTHSNITSIRRTIQIFQDNGFRPVKKVYLSGFFTGTTASIVSYLIRLLFVFVHSDTVDDKLYKLKLSFLRRFLVLGEKEG